jgi:hypothetical protein
VRERWGALPAERLVGDLRASHFIDALIRHQGSWQRERVPRSAGRLARDALQARVLYEKAKDELISFHAGTNGYPRNPSAEAKESFRRMLRNLRTDFYVRQMLLVAATFYAEERD